MNHCAKCLCRHCVIYLYSINIWIKPRDLRTKTICSRPHMSCRSETPSHICVLQIPCHLSLHDMFSLPWVLLSEYTPTQNHLLTLHFLFNNIEMCSSLEVTNGIVILIRDWGTLLAPYTIKGCSKKIQPMSPALTRWWLCGCLHPGLPRP